MASLCTLPPAFYPRGGDLLTIARQSPGKFYRQKYANRTDDELNDNRKKLILLAVKNTRPVNGEPAAH